MQAATVLLKTAYAMEHAGESAAGSQQLWGEVSAKLAAVAAFLGPAVQARVEQMPLDSAGLRQLAQTMLQYISFKDACLVTRDPEDVRAEEEEVRRWRSKWYRRLFHMLVPARLRQHSFFYAVFFAGYLTVLLSFASSIGSGDVMRSTFLNLPGYYSLGQVPLQAIAVPLVYAFMHGALYCLGWLPIAYWRGINRDLVRRWPGARRIIPFDDMVFFHRLVACTMLVSMVIAFTLAIIVMGLSCTNSSVASPLRATASPTKPSPQELAFLFFNPNIKDTTTDDDRIL